MHFAYAVARLIVNDSVLSYFNELFVPAPIPNISIKFSFNNIVMSYIIIHHF